MATSSRSLRSSRQAEARASQVGGDRRRRRGLAAVGVDRVVGTRTSPPPAAPTRAARSIGSQAPRSTTTGDPQLVLDPTADPRAPQGAPRGTRAEPRALPILVIDDSLTTRMLEQSILESAGYEVDLATSAEEGLVKARARTLRACSSSTSRCPGWTASRSSSATRADPGAARHPRHPRHLAQRRPDDRQRGRDGGRAGLHRQERVRSDASFSSGSASWWGS